MSMACTARRPTAGRVKPDTAWKTSSQAFRVDMHASNRNTASSRRSSRGNRRNSMAALSTDAVRTAAAIAAGMANQPADERASGSTTQSNAGVATATRTMTQSSRSTESRRRPDFARSSVTVPVTHTGMAARAMPPARNCSGHEPVATAARMNTPHR